MSARSLQLMENREKQMASTIWLLCIGYSINCSPGLVWRFVTTLAPDQKMDGNWSLGLFCLIWWQYSTNFIFYAVRVRQYRRAYRFLLSDIGSYVRKLARRGVSVVADQTRDRGGRSSPEHWSQGEGRASTRSTNIPLIEATSRTSTVGPNTV